MSFGNMMPKNMDSAAPVPTSGSTETITDNKEKALLESVLQKTIDRLSVHTESSSSGVISSDGAVISSTESHRRGTGVNHEFTESREVPRLIKDGAISAVTNLTQIASNRPFSLENIKNTYEQIVLCDGEGNYGFSDREYVESRKSNGEQNTGGIMTINFDRLPTKKILNIEKKSGNEFEVTVENKYLSGYKNKSTTTSFVIKLDKKLTEDDDRIIKEAKKAQKKENDKFGSTGV